MIQVSIAAPCIPFGRNTQLPSPTTPSTCQISPSSSHAILSPYRQPQIEIDQAPECRKSLVPVRAFIQEVLKRSKTTGSVLQTALCYLEAIRPQVVELVELEKTGQGIRGEPELDDRIVPGSQADFDLEASLSLDINMHPIATVGTQEGSALGSDDCMTKTVIDDHASEKTASVALAPLPPLPSPLLCPRRAFLASLILASKFMQDKCYSNRAWAKLSGLPPREISRCERALGDALGWRLWVGKTPVPDSTATTAATRALVRSRSDSNLAKSAQGAFLTSTETSSPSGSRLLRRCSTLPNNAFVNVEALPCQGGSSIIADDGQCTFVSYSTSQVTFCPFHHRRCSSAFSTFRMERFLPIPVLLLLGFRILLRRRRRHLETLPETKLFRCRSLKTTWRQSASRRLSAWIGLRCKSEAT